MTVDLHIDADEKPDDERGDPRPPRKRRWAPEASEEAAAMLRLLARTPWLVAGRDDEAIAAVRRNHAAIRDTVTRLGWVLTVEKDTVRLRKSPPVRRDAWTSTGPTPLQASWFFLLVVAAESAPPRLAIGQLVAGARAAAAEAGLPVTNEIAERRAIVRALHMLNERGVVQRVEGDLDDFVSSDDAPVLLAVQHARLAHVIANYGTTEPSEDPVAWLEQVEREPDAARRMRRRLVDDTVIYAADLDEDEADWLRRRFRGDDGEPLARAFGLHLERRAEGAAFVVPDESFRHPHELGDLPFPAAGTLAHAALLLCEHSASAGEASEDAAEGPRLGAGWRGLHESQVVAHLTQLASSRGKGAGWKSELVEDPARLTSEVQRLLMGLDLLRIVDDGTRRVWWFSPATGRWDSVASVSAGRSKEDPP